MRADYFGLIVATAVASTASRISACGDDGLLTAKEKRCTHV